MSQQMQLMYTETPCFGENKGIQKIAQNTRKYILQQATKVTIIPNFRAVFFGRSHGKKMVRTFTYFLPGTLVRFM